MRRITDAYALEHVRNGRDDRGRKKRYWMRHVGAGQSGLISATRLLCTVIIDVRNTEVSGRTGGVKQKDSV